MERNHERGGIEEVVNMAKTLNIHLAVCSLWKIKNNPINYFVSWKGLFHINKNLLTKQHLKKKQQVKMKS